MMIYKYPVVPGVKWTHQIPADAQFLSVQNQGGLIQMWFWLDPHAPKETRTFSVYVTGEEFDGDAHEYLGTFQTHGGNLVFHLFEIF